MGSREDLEDTTMEEAVAELHSTKLANQAADAMEEDVNNMAEDMLKGKLRVKPGAIRTFDTGATRNTDDNKPDYEGYLSPSVIECFGEYMTKHRRQADGGLRDSDNWKKGIPLDVYMKSLWRHFFECWKLHRKCQVNSPFVIEALCGIMFNTMGYLHVYLKNIDDDI